MLICKTCGTGAVITRKENTTEVLVADTAQKTTHTALRMTFKSYSQSSHTEVLYKIKCPKCNLQIIPEYFSNGKHYATLKRTTIDRHFEWQGQVCNHAKVFPQWRPGANYCFKCKQYSACDHKKTYPEWRSGLQSCTICARYIEIERNNNFNTHYHYGSYGGVNSYVSKPRPEKGSLQLCHKPRNG
jgi:hypothetical protein